MVKLQVDVDNDWTVAPTQNVLIVGPSLGTTSEMWRGARAFLEPEFAVVAWDLPGHGSSPSSSTPLSIESLAADVIAAADRLGVERFDYAGVSIGGAVGLVLARNYPDRIRSAAIICSAAKIGTPEAWRERAALVRQEGTGVLVAPTPSRWFAPDFIAAHADTVAQMLDVLPTISDQDYALLCEALSAFDARSTLAEISVPVLAISGDLDPVTPPESGEEIAHSVQSGTLAVIPGTSHLAVVERPDLVAQALLTFLTTLEGAS